MRRRPSHLVDVTTPEAASRSLERNIRAHHDNLPDLVECGHMALLQGYPDLARGAFDRATELALQKEDHELEAVASVGAATALHAMGHYDSAFSLFATCASHCDAHQLHMLRGVCLAWMADCQRLLGDLPAARESIASACACADVLGDEALRRTSDAIRQKIDRASS